MGASRQAENVKPLHHFVKPRVPEVSVSLSSARVPMSQELADNEEAHPGLR